MFSPRYATLLRRRSSKTHGTKFASAIVIGEIKISWVLWAHHWNGTFSQRTIIINEALVNHFGIVFYLNIVAYVDCGTTLNDVTYQVRHARGRHRTCMESWAKCICSTQTTWMRRALPIQFDDWTWRTIKTRSWDRDSVFRVRNCNGDRLRVQFPSYGRSWLVDIKLCS